MPRFFAHRLLAESQPPGIRGGGDSRSGHASPIFSKGEPEEKHDGRSRQPAKVAEGKTVWLLAPSHRHCRPVHPGHRQHGRGTGPGSACRRHALDAEAHPPEEEVWVVQRSLGEAPEGALSKRGRRRSRHARGGEHRDGHHVDQDAHQQGRLRVGRRLPARQDRPHQGGIAAAEAGAQHRPQPALRGLLADDDPVQLHHARRPDGLRRTPPPGGGAHRLPSPGLDLLLDVCHGDIHACICLPPEVLHQVGLGLEHIGRHIGRRPAARGVGYVIQRRGGHEWLPLLDRDVAGCARIAGHPRAADLQRDALCAGAPALRKLPAPCIALLCMELRRGPPDGVRGGCLPYAHNELCPGG
mmetsp:Transcript_92964/g.277467  ORF Transcript_92964/g.277467 Transcript_92964/m.277467 type:complete len:355 (+) Transcript_92964:464-1528(+)